MISYKSSLLIIAIAIVVIIVTGIIFSCKLQQIKQVTPGFSHQDWLTSWEMFAKVVTTCIAIIAGLLAFVRYIDQRELELTASNYEAAQKVREFNIQIYGQATTTGQGKRMLLNEATDLVSTLSTLDSLESPTGRIAIDRFERLYHGQLVIYEGSAVAKAMINFRDAVLKWQNTGIKPTNLLPKERSNINKLLEHSKPNSDFMRQLALKLSSACKTELEEIMTDLSPTKKVKK